MGPTQLNVFGRPSIITAYIIQDLAHGSLLRSVVVTLSEALIGFFLLGLSIVMMIAAPF